MDFDPEAVARRDAQCRDVAEVLRKAGVNSRYCRLPLMGWSSLVACEPCGPTSQRRVIISLHDDGRCEVFLSRAREVGHASPGEDRMVGVTASILLCSFPAPAGGLGEEVLRRMRRAAPEVRCLADVAAGG